jgi:hypothetical protein
MGIGILVRVELDVTAVAGLLARHVGRKPQDVWPDEGDSAHARKLARRRSWLWRYDHCRVALTRPTSRIVGAERMWSQRTISVQGSMAANEIPTALRSSLRRRP